MTQTGVPQSTVRSRGHAPDSNLPGQERSLPYRATIEPESLDAAEKEMAFLRAEIIDIQSQFARRKLVEPAIATPEYREYTAWKRTAVAACKSKEARHSFLKAWITRYNQSHAGRPKTPVLELLADVVTALEDGEDAQLALKRLVAWRDEWLDSSDV